MTDARVVSLGALAARALREGAQGRVIAVFERSLYVMLGAQALCVGPQGLRPGPLNILCEDGPLPGRLRVGDAAAVRDGALRLGAASALRLADAAVWQPPAVTGWSPQSLREGLAGLHAALPAALPADGLGLLLREGDAALPPVARAAHRAAQRLAAWVAAGGDMVSPQDAEVFCGLLGLGPGLTPSGDDFLGGAMIALDRLGRPAARDALWQALRTAAMTATGDISRAHLAAAAEGQAGEAVDALIGAVMTNQRGALAPRLAAVAAIGHTSGWDALAGAVAVLQAADARGRKEQKQTAGWAS